MAIKQGKPDKANMVVYVSGPMTGYAESNYPAFREVTNRLRMAGFTVVCPTEVLIDGGVSYEEYLRADIKALCDCNAIYLLPNWFNSKGAKLEYKIASALGFYEFYHDSNGAKIFEGVGL